MVKNKRTEAGSEAADMPASSTEPSSSKAATSSADHLRDDAQSVRSVATTQTTRGNGWNPGSWRGKATAVAGVARESISAAASNTSETILSRKPATSSTKRLSETLRSPSRSLSESSSAKKFAELSADPNSTLSTQTPNQQEGEHEPILSEDKLADKAKTPEVDVSEKPANKDQEKAAEGQDERPMPAAGWRGWWTKPRKEEETEAKAVELTMDSTKKTDDMEPQIPLKNRVTELKGAETRSGKTRSVIEPLETTATEQSQEAVVDPDLSRAQEKQARRSWFGLWGSGAVEPADDGNGLVRRKSAPLEPSQDDTVTDPIVASSEDLSKDTKADLQSKHQHQSSGSWGWWSREKPKEEPTEAPKDKAPPETGELAVANTPTQDSPKPKTVGDPTQKSSTNGTTTKKKGTPKDVVEKSVPKKPSSETSSLTDRNAAESVVEEGMRQSLSQLRPIDSPKLAPEKPRKPGNKDLVLPQFRHVYPLAPTPSYWDQMWKWFGRGPPPIKERHLAITPQPPRIRRAVAIGVHGYFPQAFVQRILGQPTGTSIRFANSAASAIDKYVQSKGYTCEIEKIALEGEGTIAARVQTLWDLLMNWVEHIRKADFILLACHSQGVPVGAQLAAKLIAMRINPRARIGVCAMAGVNLGPFPSYQSRLLNAAGHELFDFGDPNSLVSREYAAALRTLLTHHVRILYVGSIDDQLVSLESATFSNVSHPYIYRAVFVDGRIHAPDFLTHLVGFALKLRNLGVPDHGLVRELSQPLAGSLYTGEGHSRIYEEAAVYDLAVQHALETTTLAPVHGVPGVGLFEAPPPEVKEFEPPPVAGAGNPYFLPWSLRGMLEDDFVKAELKGETSELLRLYDKWRPQSKVLKDVKFRLEAVKSKL